MRTAEEIFEEWWNQELPEKGFNKTAMLDFADYRANEKANAVLHETKERINKLSIDDMKRGGARENAGRKPKYNEPTETLTFRVPKSRASEIKEKVKNWLKSHTKSHTK